MSYFYLSQIMRHLNGAYTTYFNTKRQRSGHLLQGRFKAILVDMDEYSKELSRYIHLKPIRANMIDKLGNYRWSSYLDYIGKRNPPAWLERNFILGESAVSQASRRISRKIKRDKKLKKQIKRIENKLNLSKV